MDERRTLKGLRIQGLDAYIVAWSSLLEECVIGSSTRRLVPRMIERPVAPKAWEASVHGRPNGKTSRRWSVFRAAQFDLVRFSEDGQVVNYMRLN